MNAHDVSVVQFDTKHGGFRVLPLRTVTDLARMQMKQAKVHTWIAVGYDTDEGRAVRLMRHLKNELKESPKSAGG